MKQRIFRVLNELYSHLEDRGAMYGQCLSLLAESESSDGRYDYISKLNKSLKCKMEGKIGDARAWGILTLCDLADEVVKVREQLVASSIGFSPLERDLKIALNLPGEQTSCNEIDWTAFGFCGVESIHGRTVDCTQVRERLESSMITLSDDKNFSSLEELRELSSLYIDVLTMLSRLGRSF
jgi:hypothetical protein